MQQMSPIKTSGPDGFSASFYQSNWSTVQIEVCTAIFHFLNTGEMDALINTTHIALIPKVQNPVIYKLISKVLANRLKVLLPTIISCTQSAFILGRLITDNIIAAFEAIHTMQTRMWSKVG
jgi:hypothetical protein